MITKLPPNHIFVFGSNLQGIHGKGAALTASKHFGAVQHNGRGFMGQSYAIPTKQTPYITLPLDEIEFYIHEFLGFAFNNEHFTFHVTPVGCGLAGYSKDEILPLFHKSSFFNKLNNLIFTDEWKS